MCNGVFFIALNRSIWKASLFICLVYLSHLKVEPNYFLLPISNIARSARPKWLIDISTPIRYFLERSSKHMNNNSINLHINNRIAMICESFWNFSAKFPLVLLVPRLKTIITKIATLAMWYNDIIQNGSLKASISFSIFQNKNKKKRKNNEHTLFCIGLSSRKEDEELNPNVVSSWTKNKLKKQREITNDLLII